MLDSVFEPGKNVAVAHDADVVVAGGGVSGVFAAIAAARKGIKTVLIERFGTVGGNMGPGFFVGGSLEMYLHGWGILGGSTGIPKEFIAEYAEFGGRGVPSIFPNDPKIEGPNFKGQGNFLRDSHIASYVALKMLKESNVTLMLSTYIADPILQEDRICGIFVENKSGRQAVKAKVVVDATGEADVARRAGAPIIYPKESYCEIDNHAPNGVQLFYGIAGVDWDEYHTYKQEDFGTIKVGKKAVDYRRLGSKSDGIAMGRASSRDIIGKLNAERHVCDGERVSKIEVLARMKAFENANLLKDSLVGFKDSYVVCIAPYLGARGGPCIEGEYVLTMDDLRTGKRFRDVVYMYGERRALAFTIGEFGEAKYADVPYRIMVPKKMDGLLAVGRSASCIPDTLLRHRTAIMHMGEVGGTAAALCVRNEVDPKEVNTKELQTELVKSGYYLGDEGRLGELELI